MAKPSLDWQTIFDEVFGETKKIGGDWDWSEVKDEDDLTKIAKELVEQGYFATYEEAYEKAKEKYKEWQENQEGKGRERKGKEGKGRKEGMKKGKEQEGKGMKRKERKGKEGKGRKRKGKRRILTPPSTPLAAIGAFVGVVVP